MAPYLKDISSKGNQAYCINDFQVPSSFEIGIKIVANAGGLNPLSCAETLSNTAKKQGLDFKIGVVTGDDILHEVYFISDA